MQTIQKKTTETAVAPVVKPKSRNFKAEREARAKEQAERRQQQGNRPKNNKTTVGTEIVSKIAMSERIKGMTVEIKGMIVVAIKLEMVKDVQIQ